MADLDNVIAMKQVDPERMIDRINELPDQFQDSWANVRNLSLPADYSKVTSVVVLGMGGSAIGGDLVRTLVADEMRVPMFVSRDYSVPAFVGPDTLVIGSSYSGETEETLSAFNEAKDKGARLLAVTTGGRIKDMAAQAGAPVVLFSYRAQPRAALGHSVVPIIGILQSLGLIGDKAAEIDEAVQIMQQMRAELGAEVASTNNPAKQLAVSLKGRVPVVYGEGILSEVARRWKGQFNENSKSWSFFEILPELNHNAVVGYEFPVEFAKRAFVVFLASNYMHPRVKVRIKVTQEILTNRGVTWQEIGSRGQSKLAQMMSSIYLGDYASYYLSMLYDVDPSPVKVIAFLKSRLAQVG
jgi:glucose/mannose-6-phosphate isomerase